MNKEKKYTIQLTKDDLNILQWVMHHFTDYMAHDNREDHGWNILKVAREYDIETKKEFYSLAGRLKWRLNKISDKEVKQ